VIGPELVDADAAVLAKTPRHVDHPRRHIQVKGRPQFAVVRPLRERFEMVHRLAGLDLDDGIEFAAAFLGEKDQVWVQR
jgi:hypothetical protein